MSEHNNQDLQLDTTNNGTITFASDVVAIIAGVAATEISGVAGMSGGIVGGIAELLGRKNLTKGVKVEVGNEEAAIDLYIITEFGVCIADVCRQVQENVKKAVETMTGLRCIEVNVHVLGIAFEKDAPPPPQARVK